MMMNTKKFEKKFKIKIGTLKMRLKLCKSTKLFILLQKLKGKIYLLLILRIIT